MMPSMQTKLFDIYLAIDFQNREINEQFLNNIEQAILSSIAKNLDFPREMEVKFYVLSEEGSIKTWVVGMATGLYLAIGNYGDFRGGLKQIYEDAGDLVKIVKKEVIGCTHSKVSDIIQLQDNGVVYSISSIYNALDSLEEESFNLSPNEMKKRIEAIKRMVEVVLPNMNQSDKSLFLKNLPPLISHQIPNPKPVNHEERLKYFATLNQGTRIRQPRKINKTRKGKR